MGYGYPKYNYYGPLAYYYGEIFYLASGDLIFSAKVLFATTFIVSFILMYLVGKRLWGELGGALSGIFYSFAPYHAVDTYVRGAMGEMWALMIFPGILWAILRLFDQPNHRNLLILSFFISSLILAHNLSTMIFLPIVAAIIILLALYKRSGSFFKLSILSVLISLSLTAFFWVPSYFEKDLVHVETTTYGYFSYTEHFKGLRKVFLEREWGWGSSNRVVPGGPKDDMPYQFGIVHYLVWFMSVILIIPLWRRSKLLAGTIFFSSLVITGSIFMIHPRSEPVWKLIEPLKFIQFPWRFLTLVILFSSLISGAVIYYLKPRYKPAVFLGLTILVVVLNFSYFRPEKFINTSESELLSGKNWEEQLKRSIFDYLPKSAKFPPRDIAQSDYKVLEGEIVVSNYQKQTDQIDFKVNAQTPAKIQMSLYYFPDWRVFINGQQTEVSKEGELGLVTFNLPEGDSRVLVKLYDTPLRSASNLISLITLLGVVILITKPRFLRIYG